MRFTSGRGTTSRTQILRNRERSSADARDEVLLTPALMLMYSVPGSNEEITEENFSATCCAAQNMQLMAHALGLAVGMVNWASLQG